MESFGILPGGGVFDRRDRIADFGSSRLEDSFRRTFATLLKGTGEDVKTVQELVRHANRRLTLDVYAQALTSAKRAAHLKVVEMIGPTGKRQLFPRVLTLEARFGRWLI